MSHGGTTAKKEKPPLIFGFSGALQFIVMRTLMDFSSAYSRDYLVAS